LLAAAEANGFELLVTTDQKLRYQQNLRVRRFAVLVLIVANWPALHPARGFHCSHSRSAMSRWLQLLRVIQLPPIEPYPIHAARCSWITFNDSNV
jgi:hypothetical protein